MAKAEEKHNLQINYTADTNKSTLSLRKLS
jgi:hypothetical protein